MADSSGGIVGGDELDLSGYCTLVKQPPYPCSSIGESSGFPEYVGGQAGLFLRRPMKTDMVVCATVAQFTRSTMPRSKVFCPGRRSSVEDSCRDLLAFSFQQVFNLRSVHILPISPMRANNAANV